MYGMYRKLKREISDVKKNYRNDLKFSRALAHSRLREYFGGRIHCSSLNDKYRARRFTLIKKYLSELLMPVKEKYKAESKMGGHLLKTHLYLCFGGKEKKMHLK